MIVPLQKEGVRGTEPQTAEVINNKRRQKMAKKSGKTWLWIAGAVVAVIVLFGALIGFTRGDEVKLNALTGFEVGAVEADGDFKSDEKTNIVSDLIPVEGMKVENDSDELSYVVHFYDKDEEYISSTESFTGKFDAAEVVIPDTAKYARVEFTHEEDDEISLSERLEYLKDVEVSYVKD